MRLSHATAAVTLAAAMLLASPSSATECTTIQDGILYTSGGLLIEPGYNYWGYNYEARIFNGGYCDVYRDANWCQPYKDIDLIMKWNDAWLSNKDCEADDGLLDRHFGYDSYRGSGAWETNHQSGYVNDDAWRKPRKWTYFVKIVAVPLDAYLGGDGETCSNNKWFAPGDIEIGKCIWNQFAIVQEVYNDPSAGAHGILYLSPAGPGFGQF